MARMFLIPSVAGPGVVGVSALLPHSAQTGAKGFYWIIGIGGGLAAFLSLMMVLTTRVRGQGEEEKMLHGLNHLTLTTGDLDSSVAFYVDLLGCRPRVRWARGAYLTLGDLWLCLSCDPPQPARDYSHVAFGISPEQFPAFCARLCARRASWSGRRTAAKGIHSICWIPTGTDWKSMQATWIAASPLSDSNPMRVLSGSTGAEFTPCSARRW